MSISKPAEIFTCDGCGGTFEKGRSDEKARLEAESLFGEIEAEDLEVVCEDCFQLLMNRVGHQTIQ